MHQPLPPLDVVDLFPEMRAELLRILYSLESEDWQRPTACEGWSVRDVALHILGDDIGFLSRNRDDDGLIFVTESFDELVTRINQHNALWISASRRMSRAVLLYLLAVMGDEVYAYLQTVDPFAGADTVDWAGTGEATMGLQIARELTEYWMHHQHISEALGISSLKTRRFLHPVLSAFVHELPRSYDSVTAADGTVVRLIVTGEAADSWDLLREGGAWQLYAQVDTEPTSTVTLSDDTAWRLFTKGISSQQAAQSASISGDADLGAVLLRTVAILA